MTKQKRKPGRPKTGREIREVYSVRLRPSDADKIRTHYGSLTRAVQVIVRLLS